MDFTTADAADVDFLLFAGPAPAGAPLRCLVGGPVPRMSQSLNRMRGHVIHAPLVTPASGVPATFQVNTQVFSSRPSFGALTQIFRPTSLRLQAALSITPRINGDGSVTLNLALRVGSGNIPAVGPHASVLSTVPSGDMMVLTGLPVEDQELLIFVSPVVIGGKKSVTP